MALYRQNSTGFLCEFASNPGAGYTAVTAMPTDTVANRVTWWRALDTYGQTSSWHPSVTRDAEDPSEAKLAIDITQEFALISADTSGVVTNPRDPTNSYYLGATTEVRVFRGANNVTTTEGWSFEIVEEGCEASLTEVEGIYTLAITSIPLAETQLGYVRVRAFRTEDGLPPEDGVGILEKDFRFLKVFQGQDGSSGNVIDLTNENHTIPTDADGNNGSYTGATTTASMFIGGTDDSANWTWTVTPSAGITGTATNSNRTYTVTAMSVDAGTVTFKANKTGESERSAVFTLSKAKGGIAYSLDISAGSISKSNAGVYNPASLTINATKVTTSGVSAYSGRIRIQTQATLGGAWTTQYTSASDEASTTYAIPANIVAVKVILYQAGGVTTILDQESIPVVFDGADGSSGIVMDLDNENQTVAALKDGTWISGTTATTTARLYLGATQLTSGITWSVLSATSGITYSQTNNTSSFTVTVTNMTAALVTGTVTVRATFNGVNYDQVFTISKANAGSDGTPATVYWLDTSASAIAKDKTGTYNPTSITINAYSQTGTNAQVAYTGRFRVQTQATLNGAWTTRYGSAGNESSASYSIPASIVAVKVLLYQAGGTTTLLDQETLPVVSDGQDGATGTRGSRQIVISGTSWSDSAAWLGITNQFGGMAPILSDLVTIANAASGFSVSKFYTGGAYDGDWVEPSAYINGNLLVTGTVGANAIAANAITAGKIAAGAISADKLAIGTSGKNILSNSGPTLGAETSDWSVGYYTCSPAPTVGAGWDQWRPTSGASVVINTSGTMSTAEQMEMNNLQNGGKYAVVPSGIYEASAYLSAHRCRGKVQINWYNASGTLIGVTEGSEVTSAGSGSVNNWGRSTAIVTAPSTAVQAMFICKAIGTGESGPYLFVTQAYFGAATSSQSSVSDWSPSGGGTTLIDGAGIRTGSVTADRLVAGTLTADSAAIASLNASKITAGTLTADKIYGGTLDASTITVANLSASSITGGTLNGTNVIVTNLNATNITTGTLNGARVGTGINGGNINDASITSAKIESLNAGKITTGSLSSTVIDLVGSSAVIKTSNFALGTGFRISGDGNAFFYGAAVSGSARSTNWNGSVNSGTGQPVAGTGTQGWCIDNAGNCEFNTVIVRTPGNVTVGAITSSGGYGSPSGGTNATVTTAEQSFWQPDQAAATYRGTLCFNASLSLSSGSGTAITGYIIIYRNGVAVRSNLFYFPPISGGVTNAIVPVTYVDTTKTTSAVTYNFKIRSVGANFTVNNIDEWWIELKR